MSHMQFKKRTEGYAKNGISVSEEDSREGSEPTVNEDSVKTKKYTIEKTFYMIPMMRDCVSMKRSEKGFFPKKRWQQLKD